MADEVDWSVEDEDVINGGPVPCVVCGMGSQRGGSGCCSQGCLDALNQAYPQLSSPARWDDPGALSWILGLKARLEAGQEPTDEDKVIMREMIESLRPVIDALSAAFSSMIEIVAEALKSIWDAIPSEVREILSDSAAQEEVSVLQKRGGLGRGISALITDERTFGERTIDLDTLQIRALRHPNH